MWCKNIGLRMFFSLSESPNSYSPANHWILFAFFAVVHFCLTKGQCLKSGSMNLIFRQSCEVKDACPKQWWCPTDEWRQKADLLRLYYLFTVLRKKIVKLCTISAVSSNFLIHLQWSQRKAAKGISLLLFKYHGISEELPLELLDFFQTTSG